MTSKCKCLNPEKGGTKCPTQHIALCIRGKDRECYGECIPIPNKFEKISQNFTQWSENTIKERVAEHMKDLTEQYKAFGSKEYLVNQLRSENELDFQNYSGRMKFSTSNFDEINVNYSFSFEEKDDPTERRALAF
tara:strand:- start:60 stop:464 length:405 start_codon:yes stop_codon:yes gene_type:complete